MPDTHAQTDWFASFGVNESLTSRALAAATRHGADQAELFFEHAIYTSVGLSDGKVNRAHTSIDLGVGIRVIVGDQVGYAYTEDLDPETVVKVAATAAAIARGGGSPVAVPGRRLTLPDHYPVHRYWDDVELSERVPLVRAWEKTAFALQPEIQKLNDLLFRLLLDASSELGLERLEVFLRKCLRA